MGRNATTWTKENHAGAGRRHGSKDEVPRSVKASIRAIYEEVATNEPKLIREAVIKGLKARAPASAHYLKMLSDSIDGKPVERHEITGADGEPIALIQRVVIDGSDSQD